METTKNEKPVNIVEAFILAQSKPKVWRVELNQDGKLTYNKK